MFLKSNLILLIFTVAGGQPWADPVALPPPEYSSKVSLEEAIFKRKSVRSFRDDALTLAEISQLLWSAGGKTIDALTGPSRSHPSAGGIYPLEIYLVVGKVRGLKQGIYKYFWREHTLQMVKSGDHRSFLAGAALKQLFIEQAPVTIVLTALYRKTAGSTATGEPYATCPWMPDMQPRTFIYRQQPWDWEP